MDSIETYYSPEREEKRKTDTRQNQQLMLLEPNTPNIQHSGSSDNSVIVSQYGDSDAVAYHLQHHHHQKQHKQQQQQQQQQQQLQPQHPHIPSASTDMNNFRHFVTGYFHNLSPNHRKRKQQRNQQQQEQQNHQQQNRREEQELLVSSTTTQSPNASNVNIVADNASSSSKSVQKCQKWFQKVVLPIMASLSLIISLSLLCNHLFFTHSCSCLESGRASEQIDGKTSAQRMFDKAETKRALPSMYLGLKRPSATKNPNSIVLTLKKTGKNTHCNDIGCGDNSVTIEKQKGGYYFLYFSITAASNDVTPKTEMFNIRVYKNLEPKPLLESMRTWCFNCTHDTFTLSNGGTFLMKEDDIIRVKAQVVSHVDDDNSYFGMNFLYESSDNKSGS